MSNSKLIVILGPTASGKTGLATALAYRINGEIISADSRQVYRGMTIGTGKDLAEYHCCGKHIPYHLIDIVEPGYEYNVFEFQKDFIRAYKEIQNHGNTPILCGGTGMYIDSVLKKYPLIKVPENEALRKELAKLPDEVLVHKLKSLKRLHNTTDITEHKRLIRAIEIATYEQTNRPALDFPGFTPFVFGISLERSVVRHRITQRLKSRLENGMIKEVEILLEKLPPAKIMFYGLEYKYLTLFLTGKMSKTEMFGKLETAIHQFAKRQMTWFRRMERKGTKIHWIDGNLPKEEQVKIILSKLDPV